MKRGTFLFCLVPMLAAAAAAGAQPPTRPCNSRGVPTTLFFDVDSSTINPQSRSTLDNLADTLSRLPHERILIVGHTDTSRSRSYSYGLSRRMARSVADYLASRGVMLNRMEELGVGWSRPLIRTAPRTREPRNRRVEVTICLAPTSGN